MRHSDFNKENIDNRHLDLYNWIEHSCKSAYYYNNITTAHNLDKLDVIHDSYVKCLNNIALGYTVTSNTLPGIIYQVLKEHRPKLQMISLDAENYINIYEFYSFKDVIPDDVTVIDRAIDRLAEKQFIEHIKHILTKQEYSILNMCYNFDSSLDQKSTHRETSITVGLTQSHVSRLIKKSLIKLKNNKNTREFYNY